MGTDWSVADIVENGIRTTPEATIARVADSKGRCCITRWGYLLEADREWDFHVDVSLYPVKDLEKIGWLDGDLVRAGLKHLDPDGLVRHGEALQSQAKWALSATSVRRLSGM